MSAGVTEVFGNKAATTLNNSGTLTSGATSCVVTSAAAPFPQTGNFRVLIDNEIVLVTAVSSNTWTIVRGQDGTSAASHTDGSACTHVLTAGAIVALQTTRPIFTNTASATYTCDSTGNAHDALIIHNKSGAVTYVLPAVTTGRHIELADATGVINTLANNVFLVPAASEKFNGSAGFAMTGTAYHFTNGSPTVTATSSKFQSELAVGMSIASSNQAGVNYIVSAIASDLSLTIAVNFSGSTTTTATATRTSLTFAANGGRLFIDGDATDWWVKGDGTPTKVSVTATGTFIPPAGVFSGLAIGAGGGGGGVGGDFTGGSGGGGGGGSLEGRVQPSWTPNTSLAVTIGAGGTGASAGATPGGAGGNSTLAASSTFTFCGASGAVGVVGGLCVTSRTANAQSASISSAASPVIVYVQSMAAGGSGGNAGGGTAAGAAGVDNPLGFQGGTGGTASTNAGGGGGGGGPRAAGGNGGNASAGGTGVTGGNGAANGGSGGGGGGGGNVGGAGGNGGSGYIDIIYVL